MARKSSSKIWILTLKADQEEVTACCGNFSSLLSQFGSELLQFIKLCDRYDDVASSSRTWRWLKFWERKSEPKGPSITAYMQQWMIYVNNMGWGHSNPGAWFFCSRVGL